MGTKTTVARMAVVGGSRYDQPNNILVDERTAPFAKGRSRGSLYILVELSGAGTEHDAIAEVPGVDEQAIDLRVATDIRHPGR